MARAKQKWAWVSRDKECCFVRIWYRETKPAIVSDRYWISSTVANSVLICMEVFKRLTGVSVKPCECLKVQFAGTVLEESNEADH